MTRVWFTADLHLGHANIIRYCLRPFLSPQEEELALRDPRGRWRVSDETVRRHDEALLDAINGSVGERDTLWVLGDFCWGRLETARDYRDRIRCHHVHLVWGNQVLAELAEGRSLAELADDFDLDLDCLKNLLHSFAICLDRP